MIGKHFPFDDDGKTILLVFPPASYDVLCEDKW